MKFFESHVRSNNDGNRARAKPVLAGMLALVLAGCASPPPTAPSVQVEKSDTGKFSRPTQGPSGTATKDRNRVLDPSAPGSNRVLARQRGDTDERLK
jgi:hypothetical protein